MSKKGKIYTILHSISDERREELGLRIESLIVGDLKYPVNRYLNRYSYATQATFGWDRDDLMQFIRMSIWKGVATFDPTKNAKEVTYICRILDYAFANLAKKCQTKKHSLTKLHFPEQMFITEELMIEETAEDWLHHVQTFSRLKDQITKTEMIVLVKHLLGDQEIMEIAEELGLKKTQVIKIIKDLENKMAATMGI